MKKYSYQDVFSSFNLEARKQLALIKIAAFRGGLFDKNLKDQKLISDESALELLQQALFDSVQEGRLTWVVHTEQKWLRVNFKKEQESKDPSIHIQRWMQESKPEIAEYDQEFVKMFKALGLLDECKWADGDISVAVIHGAPEEHLRERIKFIPQNFKGPAFIVTNARMLFKYEPSFAPIVASWFVKCCAQWKDRYEEAVERVQAVLKSTDKEWLTDPQGMIQQILSKMEEKEWPKESAYYRNPKPYEEDAKNGNRPSPAGLPTIHDLIEFLSKREIKPVYSVAPKPPAITKDNARDLISGNYLPKNKPIIFISNNSKGLHYISYQDFMMKAALRELEETPGEYSHHVMTVGPGADCLNFPNGLDTFAKMFFEMLSAEERRLLKSKLEGPKAGFFPAESVAQKKAGGEVVVGSSAAVRMSSDA